MTRCTALYSLLPQSLTKESPRFMMAQPGWGGTYFHSRELGSRAWSPPSWLKRTVTEPKSVCSPRQIVFSEIGGAWVTRA